MQLEGARNQNRLPTTFGSQKLCTSRIFLLLLAVTVFAVVVMWYAGTNSAAIIHKMLPRMCGVNDTREALTDSWLCSILRAQPNGLLGNYIANHTNISVGITTTGGMRQPGSKLDSTSNILLSQTWTPTGLGYILTIFYRQQLQSATNELFHLATVAARRRMQIVEPLLDVSNFRLPSISKRFATITHFSDLYNLTDVNEHFAKCLGIDYPIIAPFEEFAAAANSLSDVTLLNLMKIQIDQWCYDKTQKQHKIEATEQLVNHHISRSVAGRGTTHPLSSHIQISKAVCVNATGKISIEGVFSSAINGNTLTSTDPLLLVLPEWRSIKHDLNWFYYYDPDYVYTRCSIAKVKHSATVMKEAMHLWTHWNSSSPVLGIHIRFEKMNQKYDQDTVKGCIDKLIAAAEALRSNHSVDLHNAIAIRDYGRRGTHTCGSCSRMAKKMGIDKQLQRLGINIVEHDTVHTVAAGASGESAFASFVEMEVVAQADYLLAVGGGSFQGSIISRFMANHPTTGRKRLSQINNC